jgi:cob(I)alamin adenosyltransferase
MGSAYGSNNADTDQNNGISAGIVDIEEVHRQAILRKQSTYIDPDTGFTVFTEFAHLKRGKCCGNQCRHCPYGWSNVESATGDNNAKAISGDREATGRLVKRILDGTYYEEEDERSRGEVIHQNSANETFIDNASSNYGDVNNKNTRNSQSNNDTQCQQASKPNNATKVQGKGGRSGGTLTSKNVPYTRKGDSGTAQLFTGERRDKDDILFEALGTVDELCSIVGVVYAELQNASSVHGETTKSGITAEEASKGDSKANDATYGDLPEQLLDVMSRLFDVGSLIARPKPKNEQSNKTSTDKSIGLHSSHTTLLEEWIDTMTDQLPELTSFILPTGSPASAQLHVARTVCRRAERRMVPLVQGESTVDPATLAYINRLSDYFFAAARFVNYCDDRDEVQYRREKKDANVHRERVVVKLKK